MTTSIDEELDEAVRSLGLAFNGDDDGTLSFVPLEGTRVTDISELLDSVMDSITKRGLLDRLPPEVTGIRIDGV